MFTTAGYAGGVAGQPPIGGIAAASSLRVSLAIIGVIALLVLALSRTAREPVTPGHASPWPERQSPVRPTDTNPGGPAREPKIARDRDAIKANMEGAPIAWLRRSSVR